jgi:hypothetical protein
MLKRWQLFTACFLVAPSAALAGVSGIDRGTRYVGAVEGDANSRVVFETPEVGDAHRTSFTVWNVDESCSSGTSIDLGLGGLEVRFASDRRFVGRRYFRDERDEDFIYITEVRARGRLIGDRRARGVYSSRYEKHSRDESVPPFVCATDGFVRWKAKVKTDKG